MKHYSETVSYKKLCKSAKEIPMGDKIVWNRSMFAKTYIELNGVVNQLSTSVKAFEGLEIELTVGNQKFHNQDCYDRFEENINKLTESDNKERFAASKKGKLEELEQRIEALEAALTVNEKRPTLSIFK